MSMKHTMSRGPDNSHNSSHFFISVFGLGNLCLKNNNNKISRLDKRNESKQDK